MFVSPGNKELEAQGLRLIAGHNLQVRLHMATVIRELLNRLTVHDESKYSEDELDLVTGKPRLDRLDYGSQAYSDALVDVYGAIGHHYTANDHHPEHHPKGVAGMTLIQLLELLCDWKAASEANGGDFQESLAVSMDRFNVSEELATVLYATVKELWGD